MDKGIQVWFWSPDPAFARLISQTLGPPFCFRHSEDVDPELSAEVLRATNVILLDLRNNDGQATTEANLELMKRIVLLDSPPPVVALVNEDEPRRILKIMDMGVYDTISCPPDMAEFRLVLRRAHKYYRMESELAELRSRDQSAPQLHELIGASGNMQQVFAMARKIAPCDVSVLITGETGTGKELLSRAIHQLSGRANFPFVAFSCASLPETLIEDELFGHEKGAYTGALRERRGRFEVADQGTLFLDEIGDLSLGLQAKLLRVLQEHSFERLGSNTSVKTDIRLICATHQDLAEMVKTGKFREDLYYRLNVVQLQLPPLRDRRDDIPFLAHHFLRLFASRFDRKVRRFSLLATHALEEYDWPGNVRELENVIQRAVVVAGGSTVELSDLPPRLQGGFDELQISRSYEEEVKHFKRRLLVRTLHECGWCKQDAAKSLGLARSYLHRLINQLEIQEGEDSPVQAPEGPGETGPIM